MSRNNWIRLLTLCGMLAFGCVATAGEAATETEVGGRLQSRNFETQIVPGETHGFEQVRRVHMTGGTNQFIFVAPLNLRVSASEDRVTLTASNYSFFLSVRILAGPSAGVGSKLSRQHVLNEYPQTTVVDEFTKTVAGYEGPVFSLRGRPSGTQERSVRVALIPSRAGTIEITFNSEVRKSADAEAAFNSVLRTFRSNERGKLELIGRAIGKS